MCNKKHLQAFLTDQPIPLYIVCPWHRNQIRAFLKDQIKDRVEEQSIIDFYCIDTDNDEELDELEKEQCCIRGCKEDPDTVFFVRTTIEEVKQYLNLPEKVEFT
jgi:hypothetical protein